MIAYLVVREGNKWRDVYRLTPGQVMTIGRAPTNRIVLNDEVCSRNHCEVFQGGSESDLLRLLKQDFTSVRHIKPPSSRAESAELYVLATGFRAAAG